MPEPGRRTSPNSERSKSAIGSAIGEMLAKVRGLVTGVVIETEVLAGHRQMVLKISVAQPEHLSLVVDGDAGRLLGQIVVLRPAKRLLYLAENPGVTFNVDRARFIPPALINRQFPILTPRGVTAEPSDLPPPTSPSFALQKFRRQGFTGEWKFGQLLALIGVLPYYERAKAAHLAAMMVLEQAARDGNCSLAGPLWRALPAEERTDLAEWFQTFSPIRINVVRHEAKALLEDATDASRQPFLFEEARATPFFRLHLRSRST